MLVCMSMDILVALACTICCARTGYGVLQRRRVTGFVEKMKHCTL